MATSNFVVGVGGSAVMEALSERVVALGGLEPLAALGWVALGRGRVRCPSLPSWVWYLAVLQGGCKAGAVNNSVEGMGTS